MNTPIESENETLAMPSRIGSHCIAVWEDDRADTNELNWYLGVTESDISDGQFLVSYRYLHPKTHIKVQHATV